MPTYRGNRGNLLQHWVLAELIALIRRGQASTAKLCFIDCHAMSPYAVRSEDPSHTAAEFDAVADSLPGVGSDYERAWRSLRQGRCQYPSSASMVRHLWSGPLHMVLCEADEATAREIAQWHRTVTDVRLDLHEGDWRERFRQALPQTADAYLISLDPYMFNRHSDAPSRGNMGPSDLIRIAAAVLGLPRRPVVMQLSTYSANHDNAQDDVVRAIDPVFAAVGLVHAATVRAGGNMMSMVFVRGMLGIDEARLEDRFAKWIDQATAHTDGDSPAARASNAPVTVGKWERDTSEYQSGGTPTTQIGYVNRNRQQCMGHRGVSGNDHGQVAYRIKCLNCGHEYGANGSDIFQRKCPKDGGGAPGIPF